MLLARTKNPETKHVAHGRTATRLAAPSIAAALVWLGITMAYRYQRGSASAVKSSLTSASIAHRPPSGSAGDHAVGRDVAWTARGRPRALERRHRRDDRDDARRRLKFGCRPWLGLMLWRRLGSLQARTFGTYRLFKCQRVFLGLMCLNVELPSGSLRKGPGSVGAGGLCMCVSVCVRVTGAVHARACQCVYAFLGWANAGWRSYRQSRLKDSTLS